MAVDQATLQRQIIISGEVSGDISIEAGGKLIVAEGASVEGNVHVAPGAAAYIEGEVQGDVLAEGDLYVREGGMIGGSIRAIKRVN